MGTVTSTAKEGYAAGLYTTKNKGPIIENCYAVNEISSDYPAGLSHEGSFLSSYFNKQIAGLTAPETQARTTSQLYVKSNYKGWDFKNIWYIDEAQDYPRLRFAMGVPEQPINELDMILEPEEKLLLSVDTHLSENINMNWSSSDETVATVDSNGMVTAVAQGETTILAAAKNNNYKEVMNIIVVDSTDDYRLAADLKVGESCRATVDKNQHKSGIIWSAMDESVATVSSKGKITAQGVGLIFVTAKDEEDKEVGQVYIRVR